MSNYDKYYKQKNYFKGPCPKLIEFFESYPERGKLCDLGAGQGRDSIPLEAAGYDVTAVDISCVGLEQIKKASPNIETLCCDIYTYDISDYDFILLDSMLHFYKKNVEKETELVKNIFNGMKKGSILINNMNKSKKAQKMLEDIVGSYGDRLKTIIKEYIDYPDFNAVYHLTAYKKNWAV